MAPANNTKLGNKQKSRKSTDNTSNRKKRGEKEAVACWHFLLLHLSSSAV